MTKIYCMRVRMVRVSSQQINKCVRIQLTGRCVAARKGKRSASKTIKDGPLWLLYRMDEL